MDDVHYSSSNHEWETPDDLFQALDDVFVFTLDVCATDDNAKVPTYFTEEEDGLKNSWEGHNCWMNPPYGREIGKWIRKAAEESEKGITVVCLVPARTDTKWWFDMLNYVDEVWFIRGRLQFKGAKSCAPFPSAILVFGSPGFGSMPRGRAKLGRYEIWPVSVR